MGGAAGWASPFAEALLAGRALLPLRLRRRRLPPSCRLLQEEHGTAGLKSQSGGGLLLDACSVLGQAMTARTRVSAQARMPFTGMARGKDFQMFIEAHRLVGQSPSSGTSLSTASAAHIQTDCPSTKTMSATSVQSAGQVQPQLTPQPSPQPAAAPCRHQPAGPGPPWRPLGACLRQHWRTAA